MKLDIIRSYIITRGATNTNQISIAEPEILQKSIGDFETLLLIKEDCYLANNLLLQRKKIYTCVSNST